MKVFIAGLLVSGLSLATAQQPNPECYYSTKSNDETGNYTYALLYEDPSDNSPLTFEDVLDQVDPNGAKKLICNYAALEGSIPSRLNDYTDLKVLDVRYNALQGQFPDLTIEKLEYLDTIANPLGGTLPSLASSQDVLFYLGFSGCNIGGTIPDSYSDLTSLMVLALDYNQLYGLVPDLSGMTNLMQLYINTNSLEGPAPDISVFQYLQYAWIAENYFTGPVVVPGGSMQSFYDFDNCFTSGVMNDGSVAVPGENGCSSNAPTVAQTSAPVSSTSAPSTANTTSTSAPVADTNSTESPVANTNATSAPNADVIDAASSTQVNILVVAFVSALGFFAL